MWMFFCDPIQFDVENASLREINQKHESEMQDLKKQLQGIHAQDH